LVRGGGLLGKSLVDGRVLQGVFGEGRQAREGLM